MRILAIDGATEACSVALASGDLACFSGSAAPAKGAVLAKRDTAPADDDAALANDAAIIVRSAEGSRGEGQRLLGMVDEVLAEGGITLSMLDGLAVSVGPGAFTGVRMTVAVAQGLAFGAGLAVIPVTTLEALALQLMNRGATQVLACLDARMGEIYWGAFAADPVQWLISTAPPQVGSADAVRLPGTLYRGIGKGFAAYPQLAMLPGIELAAQDSSALPHAREIALLGAHRLALGLGLDAAELTPVYLRDKVAFTEAERRRNASLE